MRIAVLSDTHLSRSDAWLQELYDTHLAPADVLLHCGDFTGSGVLELMRLHPCFYGVCGNTDGWDVVQELPKSQIVQLDGLRIGLAHGHGYGASLESSLAQAFSGHADLVCYGHTHVYAYETFGSVRTLNPGSARKSREGPNSIAFIDYEPGTDFEVTPFALE